MDERDSGGVLFKKRIVKQQSRRKRHGGSEDDRSDESDTNVVKQSKKQRKNLMVQSSKKIGKNDKSEDHSSEDSLDEEQVKNVMVSYKSKREAERSGPSDMGATAVLEIETETDKDAQAIFETALKINKELKGEKFTFLGNTSILEKCNGSVYRERR